MLALKGNWGFFSSMEVTRSSASQAATNEQESTNAHYRLGLAYDYGDGVKVDKSIAMMWYLKAAEHGIVSAQYRLGLAYDKGEGVGKDKAEAVRWYRLAAEQGNADAQYERA